MLPERIAHRWAKALYELAQERNEVETAKEELLQIQQLLKTSKEFFLFIKSPIIPHKRKAEIIKKLFEQRFSAMITLFLEKLALKGRETILPEIVKAFMDYYYERNGILVAKVVSAAPLDSSILEEIKAFLAARYKKQILLEQEVKPRLIGGFQIWVKDKMVDLSIYGRLQQLRKQFHLTEYKARV